MFVHSKSLQFEARVTQPDKGTAHVVLSRRARAELGADRERSKFYR